MDSNWSMIAPFLTEDPAFVRGVQYGILYMRLQKSRRSRLVAVVPEADEEQTRLMASRIGWAVRRRLATAQGQLSLTFHRVTTGPDQLPL